MFNDRFNDRVRRYRLRAHLVLAVLVLFGLSAGHLATRALDRVLLWNRYVVPQWRAPTDRIAVWDTFGRPAELPSQTEAFLQVWWYDDAAAKRLGESRG